MSDDLRKGEMIVSVSQPSYDRHNLQTGILHFGVGNFHRAHEAMFMDRLFNLNEAADWAIGGVGVLPSDARMRDVLAAQDMTYTLVERAPDGRASARTIASIAEYLFAPDDPEVVIERLADPKIRIVSLTITEGGYNVDESTGVFDQANPTIVRDLEPNAVPRTVFGLIVEGLRRRRARGIPPFTVMSCDNLPRNGAIAQLAFSSFAELKEPGLGQWIRDEVSFPSSMVDRITPVTSEEDLLFVARTFGITDAWPVLPENFVQWVLEDNFSLGRPPFELVGVQLVADVEPYEHMKLRLLNASHQAMAYFGYLLGHRFVHEAANDPLIIELLSRYMSEEAEPTLEPAPGVSFSDYEQSLMDRFRNPYVRDTLLRLATDASDRLGKFLLPVVLDRRRRGLSSPIAAAVFASWIRFTSGVDEQGNSIPWSDRRQQTINESRSGRGSDPIDFLEATGFFGALTEDPDFAAAISSVFREIGDLGVRATLQSLVDAPSSNS